MLKSSRILFCFWLGFSILMVSCAGPAAVVSPQLQPSKTAPPETGEESPPTPLDKGGADLLVPTSTQQAKPAVAYPKAAHPLEVENGCSSSRLMESVLLSRFDQDRSTHLLTPVDPLSGQALCDYQPVSTGLSASHAFGPDKGSAQTLALVVARQDDHSDGGLHLFDLANWQDQVTNIEIPSWVIAMTFNPQGTRLAIVYPEAGMEEDVWSNNSRMIVIDVVAGQVVAETVLPLTPRLLAFSEDSTSLMAYGVTNQDSSGLDGAARALLLDAASMEVVWELALETVADGQTRLYTSDGTEEYIWWGPAAVLSPEHQALFIVHADEDKLTSVDFSERIWDTVEIQPQLSWFERLLSLTAGVARAKVVDGTTKQAILSEDGKRLYIAGQTSETWQDENGNWQFSQKPLGLQVVDVPSRTEIAHLDTEASELDLSPDGSHLYLRGWSGSGAWTEIVDLEKLEIVNRLVGRRLIPAARLNGEPVLLSSSSNSGAQTTLAVFDPESLEEINKWWVWGYAEWVNPSSP